MNLDFDFQGKYYEIEILNLYYLPGNYNYPEEFDYSIGQVYIDGDRVHGKWSPGEELGEVISCMVYDQMITEK